MSLNIKNDETCRLARELAQLTGGKHDRRDHHRAPRAAGAREAAAEIRMRC